MAFKVADRIKEESATTGVGSISLSGVSVAGFQPFSSGLSDGDYTFYVLEENVAWEVGYGRFTSNTLERTTIFDSTNNGSAISLGGSGTVSVTYPADRSVYLDESLNAVSGSGVTFENSSKILNTDDTYLYWNNDRLADNDDVVYISGIAAYASGEAVASDTSYVSGIATYASGETITNASNIQSNTDSISVLNDDTVYLSGLTENNNVLATYAYERGQLNKTNVEYVSGIAVYASGSVLKSVASVNSNGNITSDVTLVTTAAATITMTLPAPVTGQVFTVKKVDNGAGSAVVDQNGSETIDGATSKTLSSQYESVTVVSDGTNWFVI
jgi:hypothetical protein